MAFTTYTGDTEIITNIGTTPDERGLTTEEFKAKFDEGLTALKTWFNATHLPELVTNDIQYLYRQAIINGNFDIWQRGTSFVNIADGGFSADRWKSVYNNGSTTTISRGNTNLPDGSQYYLEVNHTSSDDSGIRQIIESGWAFKNKQVTVSFKARKKTSAFNRDLNVILKYGDATFSIGSQTDIETKTISNASLSDSTWHSYSGTFTVPNSASVLTLALDIKAATAGTDGFQITQVQLCAGDVALPFMPKSFEEELWACMRYYEKSYGYSIAPGTNLQTNGLHSLIVPSNSIGASQPYGTVNFKVNKRTSPTVTIRPYTTASNTNQVSNDGGTDLGANSGSVDVASETSFLIKSGASATTTNNIVKFHWTADSEL